MWWIEDEGFGWMEWILPLLMRRRVLGWIVIDVGETEWMIVPWIAKVVVLGVDGGILNGDDELKTWLYTGRCPRDLTLTAMLGYLHPRMPWVGL